MSKFPEIPCENAYEGLVRNNPDLLVEWVESGELTEGSDLTFAAEQLGKCQKGLPAHTDSGQQLFHSPKVEIIST